MSDESPNLGSRLRKLIAASAPGGRLLIAFSGGRDSSVLLHAIAHACPDRELLAIHVDHGLNPRSAQWARHCRDFAGKLGVAVRVESLTLEKGGGENLEAMARQARYGVMAGMLAPGDTLLTAHHAGDQLETLLQRLMRGAGRMGLSGIRRSRSLGAGQLLRPMLDTEESEIQAWAEDHGLSWVEDPSNRDERFDRNFLRHRVLPLLRQRWPHAEAQAARTSAHLAEEARLLQALAELDQQSVVDERGIVISGLRQLSAERQRNVLRHWLISTADYPPGADWLGRLQKEVMDARDDASPELVFGEYRIRRHAGRLYLGARDRPLPEPGPFQWTAPARECLLPGNGALELDSREPGPDCVCLPALVSVRYRRPGDVFHDGRHRRRLKEWMRLAGIPEEQRESVPILLDGERIFAVGESVVDPGYFRRNCRENDFRCGRLRWRRGA
ncbi:tRNA lysidine(34) synthetase TilS [Natronospira bacteriovora]|uniref:tRNA(Ile)-lysidine synthase n=1 Tax=Natronospira bacteriovora TaxID=3069753 RepID=A0ABU0W2V0_9GAMM|nr:tRNA lysidine(34) synthetase TilS [Natronospira sp. AB-CW4]MDQ2068328.1 tRNA lysidine(34) synthetase TilS [Natronospira sp. AB-CW4]